jgi:hypothetical protein
MLAYVARKEAASTESSLGYERACGTNAGSRMRRQYRVKHKQRYDPWKPVEQHPHTFSHNKRFTLTQNCRTKDHFISETYTGQTKHNFIHVHKSVIKTDSARIYCLQPVGPPKNACLTLIHAPDRPPRSTQRGWVKPDHESHVMLANREPMKG